MAPKTPRSSKQNKAATSANGNGGGGENDSKRFKAGDKVFVEDGDWFWPAKVRDDQHCKSNQYVVHYDGWNQRHDEIVEAACVFPWTEENQERAKKAQV